MPELRDYPSSIPFGAFFSYSPKGTSDVSTKSRRLRDVIKASRNEQLEAAAELLSDYVQKGELGDSFEGGPTLVPAPRSSPLVSGALWPAKRICEAMVAVGLGSEVVPCLQRDTAVPKAAFARPGERPTVEQHVGSMSIATELTVRGRILVVDDFVTKGRMLYASGVHAAWAFPDVEVRTFALVRTMGLIPEIEAIIDPCEGWLTFRSGDIDRDP